MKEGSVIREMTWCATRVGKGAPLYLEGSKKQLARDSLNSDDETKADTPESCAVVAYFDHVGNFILHHYSTDRNAIC